MEASLDLAGFEAGIRPQLRSFLLKCLQVNPLNRNTAGQLQQAGWLSGNVTSTELGRAVGGSMAALGARIERLDAHVVEGFEDMRARLATGAGEVI